MFILIFSHTQRDFCFYCLQLNLTAGTNELALIKEGGGGVIIFTEKEGEAKVRGDEIKREGLKSITNYGNFTRNHCGVNFVNFEQFYLGMWHRIVSRSDFKHFAFYVIEIVRTSNIHHISIDYKHNYTV